MPSDNLSTNCILSIVLSFGNNRVVLAHSLLHQGLAAIAVLMSMAGKTSLLCVHVLVLGLGADQAAISMSISWCKTFIDLAAVSVSMPWRLIHAGSGLGGCVRVLVAGEVGALLHTPGEGQAALRQMHYTSRW